MFYSCKTKTGHRIRRELTSETIFTGVIMGWHGLERNRKIDSPILTRRARFERLLAFRMSLKNHKTAYFFKV